MMRTRWIGLALTGLVGLGGPAATQDDAVGPFFPLAGSPLIAPVIDLSFGSCAVDEEGDSRQTGVHLPPTPDEDLMPPWEPGTRLRVTMIAPETQPRIGLFEALRREHLVMGAGQSSHDIPLETIRRIDVSRGHRPSVRGGLFGALVGGMVGSVSFGYLANRDDYGVPGGGQDDTKFVIGGIVGGLAGGALGALISRKERWDRVDLEQLTPPRPATPKPGSTP